MRCVLVFAILLGSIGPLYAEEEHSFWWYTRAKVACIPDVLRICKSAMPDEGKVRDCMKTKEAVVSSDCAAFYPGGKNAD